MAEESHFCILCEPTGNNCFGDTVCVTRGLNKIIETSVSKGDNVKKLLENKSSVVVHVKCRKDYTRRLEPVTSKPQTAWHHFVREHIEDGFVKLKFVTSDKNIADIFTKNIFSNIYGSHKRMMIQELPD